MIEPTEGEVLIQGRPAAQERPELLRRRIGYVIQSIGLFPHMSVAENIAVVPKLLEWSTARVGLRVEELLLLVGLDPARYRSKYPRELSGGEAQRVGVARALAADPPILLMDEPFGAVDPLNRQILQSEFLKIQRRLKKTVVLVTHDLDEAIRVADRIVLMSKGRLVQTGSPEDLLARPRNRFVRNFVGADRALKRLSRFPVTEHMRPSASLSIAEAGFLEKVASFRAEGRRFVWITNRNNTFFGWIDLKDLNGGVDARRAVTRANAADIAVGTSASLREALSRMLGQEIKVVPVLDGEGRPVGEISLADIERATGG
jgi:osmoprotectant transport system ATP-binding protein